MDQHVGSELPPIQETEQQQIPQGPTNEALGTASYAEAQTGRAIEQGAPQGQQPAPPVNNPLLPQAPPSVHPAPPVATPASFTGIPQIADDNDLIEKEWVLKAKEIVARTRHDPYQQNKQVESFKADYMKKRYNKDIKLTED